MRDKLRSYQHLLLSRAGGNIATYDHIVAGTVWQAMEHAHCMFYHGSQVGGAHAKPRDIMLTAPGRPSLLSAA